MAEPLWKPSDARVRQANMTRFLQFVNQRQSLSLSDYSELYEWSIRKIPDFWASMWEFGEIRASQPFKQVVQGMNTMPGTKWFKGARLNFAENLLRWRDEREAIVFKGEGRDPERVRSLCRRAAAAGGPAGHRGDGATCRLAALVLRAGVQGPFPGRTSHGSGGPDGAAKDLVLDALFRPAPGPERRGGAHGGRAGGRAASP